LHLNYFVLLTEEAGWTPIPETERENSTYSEYDKNHSGESLKISTVRFLTTVFAAKRNSVGIRSGVDPWIDLMICKVN